MHSASETAAVPGPSLWPQVAQRSGVQSMQSASDALPASEYLPATQSMQSAAEMLPGLRPYLPDAQSVHATVEAAENLPVAHRMHVDAPGRATVFVTDPAAQPMHIEVPAEAA